MDNSNEFLDGYSDVSEFSKAALQATVTAIRHCTEVSAINSTMCDSSVPIKEVNSAQGQKLLHLMSEIMKHQAIKKNINSLDLEDKVDMLADVNDLIMEKIGLALDDASGKKKKEPTLCLASVNTKDLIRTSWNKIGTTEDVTPNYRLITAKNILRPQLKFLEKVDNTEQPFQPSIKEKPHSIRPLAIILEPTTQGAMFSHPYECELNHFKPQPEQIKAVTPEKPKSLAEIPLIYIDKPEQITELLNDLKGQKELAIDLEHHSYRSFLGITCLMQLSTRQKDYIIDTLELRSNLQILNEVFTDPKIVKVLHGAEKDIQWLQRDFGLYIVNMFDTGQACRVLNFQSCALAYLLKLYCQVTADKKYQLADWRIRPLPEEMIRYAREDTHYLLYIYDMLKNELLAQGNEQQNLLLSVLERSKHICSERYEKPVFNEDSHMALYDKSKRLFNSRQMYALKELCRWRNKIARTNDESLGYVLPNHMLLQIAEILPREMQGVLGCCNPIPPLVQQQLNELHSIVHMARELPLVKVESQQLQIDIAQTQQRVDLDNPLSCPHDLSLLNDNVATSSSASLKPVLRGSLKAVQAKSQPEISVFGEQTSITPNKKYLNVKKSLLNNSTPYQSYLVMKSTEVTKPDDEKQQIEGQSVKIAATSVEEMETCEVQDDKEIEEVEEEEEDQPIRQIIQKKKRRKAKGLQRQAKKIKGEQDFQPFDYSKVDFKKELIAPKKFKKRRDHFDTDATQIEHKGKRMRKPRRNNNKSLTYTKKM